MTSRILSHLLIVLLLFASPARAATEPRNLAKGRPYTVSPEPNYPLTTDAGDGAQLTDGQRTDNECLWADPKAVGWSNPGGPVVITIDLGERRDIGGVSFSTAGGRASVTVPFAIYVLTSDDAENFFLAGELIAASAPNGLPAPIGYSKHVFRSDAGLPGRGRYMRLVVVPSGPYVMCDEIEVFAAGDQQAIPPHGEAVSDPRQLVEQLKRDTIVRGRLTRDLLDLEKLPGYVRQESLWTAVRQMPTVTEIAWRRGLPYNDLHRQIWATHAKWVRNRTNTSPALRVWPANRWDPLKPFDLPPKGSTDRPMKLDVQMMRSEHRSAALNLTNLSDQSTHVTISCALAPSLPDAALSVREVIFVECQDRDIVANALPEAAREADAWVVEVPAGATRQAWLMFNSAGTEAGTYAGSIGVRCADLSVDAHVPLKLTVTPIDMPAEPTLTVTTWDYAHPGGYIRYGKVWRDAVQQMREHYIRAPWLSPGAIPWPRMDHGTLDAQGNVTDKMDWSKIDEWIDAWPDARLFMIYMGEFNVFPESQIPQDDPRTERAMTQFMKLFLGRFECKGIPASRVAFMTRDEPYSDDKEASIIKWATLIKKINPDLLIFNDPIRDDPTQTPAELYALSDIVCNNLPKYYLRQKTIDFYQAMRNSGKTLWTYQCSGPVKQLDPYNYFLLQAWHAYRGGMTGSGFWALADARHVPFGTIGSWNDFSLTGETYSITYWDEHGVTDSKQLEAIREGVQDYEYLVMLRDAIDAAGASAGGAKARLERAVAKVTNGYTSGNIHWRGTTDRSLAERARLDVLQDLLKLRAARE